MPLAGLSEDLNCRSTAGVRPAVGLSLWIRRFHDIEGEETENVIEHHRGAARIT